MFLISIICFLSYQTSMYYIKNNNKVRDIFRPVFIITDFLRFGFYFFCVFGFFFLLLNIFEFSQIDLSTTNETQNKIMQTKSNPIKDIIKSSLSIYLGFSSLIYLISQKEFRNRDKYKNLRDLVTTFGLIALLLFLPFGILGIYDSLSNTSNQFSSKFYSFSSGLVVTIFMASLFCLSILKLSAHKKNTTLRNILWSLLSITSFVATVYFILYFLGISLIKLVTSSFYSVITTLSQYFKF